MRTRLSFMAAVLALAPQAASAEVVDRSSQGFELVRTATIAAAPSAVWKTLLQPALWWDGRHTYSGDARNLTIDLSSGCFCERLPRGEVRHMTVVYADGGSTLRLAGGLGPLQATGAAGALSIQLKPVEAATEVTLTYSVGGYAKGGLANWADPVDSVLGQQLSRLTSALEPASASRSP